MEMQNQTSNGTFGSLDHDTPNVSLHWTYTVAKILMKYVLPVIIITGLPGNVVSILVFLTRDLRRLSSSVYVLAVLMSDIGFLINLLFLWLEVLGIRVNHEEGACQFLVFLSYACSFLSVWYTVCITIENYIAICHPTKVNVFCTRSRALIVVTLLACGSLVVYITSAAATEVRADKTGQRMCERKGEPFMSVMKALSIFDSVVTLLLPLVCVTIMLVAIVLSIINTYRWRRSSPGSQKRRAELMDIPQVRVAKMLFALSLSYVIMNLPSHVSRLYYMINDMIHTMGGGGGGGTVVGAGESHMLISQEAVWCSSCSCSDLICTTPSSSFSSSPSARTSGAPSEKRV
ncbi:growth hormone secretagogue receptor type 1-like isoform X1 [Pomacea canaliculata]|nr:growth hormone secretagogue receptor type 1-like isoform X1 [Pomacea canaliculata]